MEEGNFSRESFVTPPDQAAGSSTRAAGFLLLLGLLGALGFVAYKLLQGNSLANLTNNNPTAETSQLLERMDHFEKRLEQLEKRRRTTGADATDSKGSPNMASSSAGSAVHRTPFRVAVSGALNPDRTTSAGAVTDPRLSRLQEGVGALREDVNANEESWKAATDRLADVAGELGSQRGELARNREALDQLLARSEHNFLRFELRRGGQRQAVGPLVLLLESVDGKRQRYSLRVFADDRWIDLKDHSLFEAVTLYVSGKKQNPLELVATEIRRDLVVGYLAVPQVEPAR